MVLPSTVILIIETVNIASNSRNAKRVRCTSISSALDRDDDYNGSDDGGLSALTVVRTGGSLPRTISPFLMGQRVQRPYGGLVAVSGSYGYPLQTPESREPTLHPPSFKYSNSRQCHFK
jgi:hypothetical protein